MLDLGCGDGALLDFLVRTKGVKGRGIELSEAGVLTCVRRGLSVRQGNLRRLHAARMSVHGRARRINLQAEGIRSACEVCRFFGRSGEA